jgi:hypothetical protein
MQNMDIVPSGYWEEDTVLVYGVLSSFLDLSDDQINQLINNLIRFNNSYFALELLASLEHEKLVKVKILSLDIEHYIKEARDYIGEYGEEKLKDLKFASLSELLNDDYIESLFLTDCLELQVKVLNREAITAELISYLKGFIDDKYEKSSTGHWPFSKQKAWISRLLLRKSDGVSRTLLSVTWADFEADYVGYFHGVAAPIFCLAYQELIKIKDIQINETKQSPHLETNYEVEVLETYEQLLVLFNQYRDSFSPMVYKENKDTVKDKNIDNESESEFQSSLRPIRFWSDTEINNEHRVTLTLQGRVLRVIIDGKYYPAIKRFKDTKNDSYRACLKLITDAGEPIKKSELGLIKTGTLLKDIPKNMGFKGILRELFVEYDSTEGTLLIHKNRILNNEDNNRLKAYIGRAKKITK